MTGLGLFQPIMPDDDMLSLDDVFSPSQLNGSSPVNASDGLVLATDTPSPPSVGIGSAFHPWVRRE